MTEPSPAAPPRRLAKVPWLTPAIFGFGIASLLSDLGHEAGTATMPALLTALGAAPAALGLIEGIADGVVSLGKLYGGQLANRLRWRKPLTIAGYLVTGLAVGLFGVAQSWVHLLLARVIGWLAKGLRGPSRSAMLADVAAKAALGRAIGFHRAMDTVGAVLGPLLATLLLSRIPVRQVFLWAMLPGILAALAFAVLVRGQQHTIKEPPPSLWQSLQRLPGGFRRFLLAVLLFGAGDFARTLLILRAAQLLTPTYGATRAAAIGMLLFVLHNLVAAICAYPVGRIADSVSPRKLLAVGYGLGVVTAMLAALAQPSLAMLTLLFGCAGLVIGIEETIESVVTARLVEGPLRGSAYGALAATNGVGDLISSSAVGLLWTAFGPLAAFLSAAVACALGTGLLVFDLHGAPDKPPDKPADQAASG